MVKNLAEKRPITLGGREPYFRRFLAAVQLLQQITNLVQVDEPMPLGDMPAADASRGDSWQPWQWLMRTQAAGDGKSHYTQRA
jgi:hypothetical protein